MLSINYQNKHYVKTTIYYLFYDSSNNDETLLKSCKIGFTLIDTPLNPYKPDEAKEGRDAFLEKRKPNFPKKWIP